MKFAVRALLLSALLLTVSAQAAGRKVIIDQKGGANGNMLYLPLDKLVERSREGDSSSVPVRPTVTVEEQQAASDARSRVER